MTLVKIKIKVGSLEFDAEGDKDWVSKQLDKIIDKANSLSKLASPLDSSQSKEHIRQWNPTQKLHKSHWLHF